eukprot:TRINITY_DN67867_c0_g1_i1.p1 TRINITY_DN67867_c0_g1~~TRINITY_DN67867_c0_g1_i1.p1  ORF type:complete len:554 (+),score=159.35 TRINITY_DN67867_c0_g1_i1:51-1712(+)
MNVTKSNFEEAAAQIEELLPTATFIAIDEEMTGISIPGLQERIEDVPARRYAKMREVATRYNIIQFGLALFHERDSCENSYIAHVYNFFLFPEAGPVNMEATGVAFNRDHGMDWNMWIREGVPYVNRESAQKLRASLLPWEAEASTPTGGKSTAANGTSEAKNGQRERIKLTKAADVETTSKAIEALKAWLEDEGKKEETEFELLTTNAYIRRFMYETMAADFPDLTVESRPTEVRGISTLVVLRLSASQKEEREAKVRAEKETELARKVGFRRVFNALAAAKKPVVGHACMFDWLFAHSHFESLPESYAEFKELIHGSFPLLFDTQLLAKSEPFKFLPQEGAESVPQHRFGSHALGQVYKVFFEESETARKAGKPAVEVTFAPSHDRYSGDCAAFHEAGYDAYVTGYVFAHMAKEVLKAEGVSKFNGRMTMFRGLFDFNVAAADELVAKGVYVHTRGLKGRAGDALRTAFAEVKASEGDSSEPAEVQIKWINDDSAFAVLPESCSAAVAEMLKRVKAAGGTVDGLTFTAGEEWFASQAAGKDEPPAKRQRTA